MLIHTFRTRLLCAALTCAALILAAAAHPASAQFWEKKPWTEWSKGEAEKILTDSPWSRTFSSSDVKLEAGGIRGGGTAEREVRPTIEYIAQLRSALPVRQAVVRLMQIQSKYDKMTAEEKRNFDRQANDYLNQDFSNRVVVHIVYSANVSVLQQGLDDTWRTSTTDLPADTYLVAPNGSRIEMVRYEPASPGTPEFELIFKKELNGEPIVNKIDKKFHVQLPMINKDKIRQQTALPTQLMGTSQSRGPGQETAFFETRVLFEFDVAKMMFNGKLEY